MADTINGFLLHRGDSASHIAQLACGRDAADVDWINYLSTTGDDWLVFTGDLRIQRNAAERRAYRQAGLKGVALAPAFQTFPINRQAAFVLWRWADLDDIVRLTAAPFLFELPAHRHSRLRTLSL